MLWSERLLLASTDATAVAQTIFVVAKVAKTFGVVIRPKLLASFATVNQYRYRFLLPSNPDRIRKYSSVNIVVIAAAT